MRDAMTPPDRPAPTISAPTVSAPTVPAAQVPPRRRRVVALSVITSLALAAALAVVNVAASRVVVRADLTEEGLYTLTPATKSVLRRLSDPCRIVVYWGEKVPGTAEPVRRRLRGLLEEYVAHGEGRVVVQWPKMDENGTKDADEKGVMETSFAVLEANERSIVKSHAGLAILYEDKTASIPMLVELAEESRGFSLLTDIEYQLTSRIHKLARKDTQLVGLVTDTQAPQFNFMNPRQPTDQFTVLASALEEVYGTGLRRSVDLEQPVDEKLGTLVVLAPRDWSEKKVFHLEQFLLRGGRVFLLMNPVDIDVAFGQRVPPRSSGLETWLKSIGVEVAPGVLVDFDPKGHGAAITGQGDFTRFEYWIRLQSENLDRTNPGLKDLDGTPLYFASEIVVDPKASEEAGRTVTTLATTSASGYRRGDAMGLNRRETKEGKALGKHPVMVALQGTFTSHWKGRTSPVDPPPAEPAMDDAPAAPVEPATTDEPPKDEAPKDETPKDAPPKDAPPKEEAPGEAPGDPDGAKGPEGEAGAAPPAPEKPARLDEGKGLLVILGDADLVSDSFSGFPRLDRTGGATNFINGVGGFTLVPNVIGWMSGGDELLSLRARGSSIRKLEEISKEKASTLETVNIFGLPVLVLILGLVVYFVRKHRS